MKLNQSVLLLGIDGTQTLPIAKSLHKKGIKVYGFYYEKLSYGFGTKYVKHKTITPPVSEPKEYFDFLKMFLSRNKIDVIIPLGDHTAQLLSLYKKELSRLSQFIIPDIEIFNAGYNKNSLMKVCTNNSFPHPRTIDLEDSASIIPEDIFPALIKPNIMTGGRGMVRANNMKEFNEKYPYTRKNYGACHLQEFISPGGRQLKVQLFMDNQSNLCYSSVIHKQRFYPENGGSSCCNVTIQDNSLVKMCSEILQKIKWIGFADFDLIEDPKDDIVKVMEINPRIPACVKSAVVSGVDYGSIIFDASLGFKSRKYEYKPGISLRHIGFDMLWFLRSKNRFKTNPNWFSFWGKNIYFQDFSWDDPLPFIFGTIGNIKKQFSSEFRKTKVGLR